MGRFRVIQRAGNHIAAAVAQASVEGFAAPAEPKSATVRSIAEWLRGYFEPTRSRARALRKIRNSHGVAS